MVEIDYSDAEATISVLLTTLGRYCIELATSGKEERVKFNEQLQKIINENTILRQKLNKYEPQTPPKQ